LLHLIIIALFAVIAIHDSVAGGGRFGPAVHSGLTPGWAWAASLGPMLALAGVTWLIIRTLAREVEMTGSGRAADLADRMLGVSRWSALLIHAINILLIGWLGAVRGVVGDLIVIDELLAIAPALLVFIIGWWAYYPIDVYFKDATTYRLMETGQPMYPPVSRRMFVSLQFRHQVLLMLVPLTMVYAWGEAVDRAITRLVHRATGTGWISYAGRWLVDDQNRAAAASILQIVGVVAVFIASPLLLKRVWDTVRLGPGPMHDRLTALCSASKVRVKDLLVWRTHGTMLNGAVIGLIGPLRYILLTDALLDQLPQRQVEAVMAHEVGHARHAHMPWLAAGLLVGFSVGALVVSLVSWLGLNVVALMGHAQLAEMLSGSWGLSGAMIVCTFMCGIAWFGFVSRRFEWQADAFAVQQLSRTPSAEDDQPTLWDEQAQKAEAVSPSAIDAMTGALEAVARLNHIPRHQFTWRHGSIANRQARLRRLAGRPLGKLPIDRTARWIKRAVAGAIVLLIAGMVLERFVPGAAGPREEQHGQEVGR
jgi:Zn-dependent protease with chaperone function